MTWHDFPWFAFRGFSVGFAIGVFMWLLSKITTVISSFFRPPKLD